MQSIVVFRFCDTLRFAPIQNLRYSGQSTAGMVVRLAIDRKNCPEVNKPSS